MSVLDIAFAAVPAVVLGAQAPPGPGAAETACGPVDEASAVCVGVFNATGRPGLAKVAETVLVPPAKIAVIVLLAVLAQRLLQRTIRRFVVAMHGDRSHGPAPAGVDHAPPALDAAAGATTRRAQRAETIAALLRSVGVVGVWTIAAFMSLSELGLDLGPLIAGAGIVGVALGFGSQHLVKDFVSGVFMLVEDQYGVGDVIDAGPATGRVEGVSLRTTRLRDEYGTVWHMPNGQISRVGNQSQQWARALLDVEVAYETDIPEATEVIKSTADQLCSEEAFEGVILEEPEVWGVQNLGADGIAIRLVVKTAPDAQLHVERELRARLKKAFDAAGIEIPFPQRTVWHRVDDGQRLKS